MSFCYSESCQGAHSDMKKHLISFCLFWAIFVIALTIRFLYAFVILDMFSITSFLGPRLCVSILKPHPFMSLINFKKYFQLHIYIYIYIPLHLISRIAHCNEKGENVMFAFRNISSSPCRVHSLCQRLCNGTALLTTSCICTELVHSMSSPMPSNYFHMSE